ncbi:hypothetical protein KA005_07130, partial [bacterium]|nr:hypothetical protein [bacterium]
MTSRGIGKKNRISGAPGYQPGSCKAGKAGYWWQLLVFKNIFDYARIAGIKIIPPRRNDHSRSATL